MTLVSNLKKLRYLHVFRYYDPYNCHEDLCTRNATRVKGLAQGFMTLVSNLKKLRFLHLCGNYGFSKKSDEGATFLSNDLKYIDFCWYPASLFPESFQPRNLLVLKLHGTLQKELWKGRKSMPCLKELELTYMMALVRTPDIGGLSCLQMLIIKDCKSLEEIHQSVGNHTSLVNLHVESCNKLASFPSIVRMEKLEILRISNCNALLNEVSVHQNLPCLKELKLTCVHDLARTPDFGGLPCVQEVTFSQCGSLEKIHPSIGSHSSLVDIFVHKCPKLTRFPTIVRMEKLKILRIWNCNALLEFPNIEANMDSLEILDLMNLEIEVLPSSVGRYCTNLILLRLDKCSKLKTIEGNLPHLLRKLYLTSCQLKDGEIPREIGGLSSLIELRLGSNHFSRVDINLSQLTQLKLLSLSYCKMLVELPELPPNLAILKANNCNSLKAIREDIYSNCKWLCEFSVSSEWGECCKFFGGNRLLESMLQGNAIENHQCMSLILRGVEVPKEFEPRLLGGSRCKLQLPDNWFNEYTGFLFCFVLEKRVPRRIWITMLQEEKLVEGGGKMGMRGFQDEQVFYEEDESVDDERKHTWVVYVSFGSLESTAWWDQTSTAVDFSIRQPVSEKKCISGFGARLVSKKNQMKETKTTKNSSSEFSDDDGDYKYKFQICHDSKSKLGCEFYFD